MIDLLIINPGGAKQIYQSLADEFAAIEPPMWCRLIAGYVRDRGYDVRILDAAAENLDADTVAERAREMRPRLVCVAVFGHWVSASTQTMPPAGEICAAIRGKIDARIVMVGGHPAALPERTFAEEDVDYVCTGEGPRTIERLLAGARPESVPGLVWKGGKTPPAPLLDLAELHGDAWDLLPMDRYRAHNWQCFDGSPRQPYASIYTSLSCPYACSFCMIDSLFRATKARQYRMRAPQDVVAEVAMLHQRYGVTTFRITDEMFVLNPRHYGAICDGLAALPFAADLNIWAYARVDTVKEGLLGRMRNAGIRWLCLGIESASEHVRDGAKKRLDDQDIVDVVRRIQNAGIYVLGNYIFGLPDDSTDRMQATLDLSLALRCEFSNYYSAMAYPGSPLYDDAVARGAALPASWRGFSQHGYETHPLGNEHCSSADILEFRDRAWTTYFTDPAYLASVREKFGAVAVGHIREMTAIPLRRRLIEENRHA